MLRFRFPDRSETQGLINIPPVGSPFAVRRAPPKMRKTAEICTINPPVTGKQRTCDIIAAKRGNILYNQENQPASIDVITMLMDIVNIGDRRDEGNYVL